MPMRKFTPYLFLVFSFFFLSALTVTAQDVQVKGKILDENTGDPLPFVNIGIKDTSVGAFTNEDGVFRMELPAGVYTLVISSVGF